MAASSGFCLQLSAPFTRPLLPKTRIAPVTLAPRRCRPCGSHEADAYIGSTWLVALGTGFAVGSGAVLRRASGPSVERATEKLVQLGIRPQDLEEQFTRSSGPGGQNVNKVETAVRLKHVPSGIAVKAQTHRTQLENRVSARRRLAELYEKEVLGRETKADRKAKRIRANKARAARRAKQKAAQKAAAAASESADGDDADVDYDSETDDSDSSGAEDSARTGQRGKTARAQQIAAASAALRALELGELSSSVPHVETTPSISRSHTTMDPDGGGEKVSQLLRKAKQSAAGAFCVLQVGACDGDAETAHDPVQELLVDSDVRAALVEPNPPVFARLRDNVASRFGVNLDDPQGGSRPRVQCVRAAVTDSVDCGELPFFVVSPRLAADHPRTPHWALYHVSSLTRQHVLKHHVHLGLSEDQFGEYIEQVNVPCLTPSEVLLEVGFAASDVHLLAIDAEGYDVRILRSFLSVPDFLPRAIVFEATHAEDRELREVSAELGKRGYELDTESHWGVENVLAWRPADIDGNRSCREAV